MKSIFRIFSLSLFLLLGTLALGCRSTPPTPSTTTPTPIPTPTPVLVVPPHAQNPHNFLAKTFIGYQGWFSVPQLGLLNDWNHWAPEGAPGLGNIGFDLYPDLRDFPAHALRPSGLSPLRNGNPSELFSSDHETTIKIHFDWMRAAGLDGLNLQRFVLAVENQRGLRTRWRNSIAQRIREEAERRGKNFFLTYDITRATPATLYDVIKRDWTEQIEGRLELPRSRAYARQDGKPVVELWGFGYWDRPGDVNKTIELINWFKQKGYYVVGGVPYYWRTEDHDSQPGWLSAYAAYDVIQPWAVGRYRDIAELEHNHLPIHQADLDWCKANGITYQRVIFPGFSWSNLVPGNPINQIPRQGGKFMWRQANLAADMQVSAMIAMFDEFDEGTAIAKVAETQRDTPEGIPFLTLDADGFQMSSDFYLRLSGEITKLLRGQRWNDPKVPIPYR